MGCRNFSCIPGAIIAFFKHMMDVSSTDGGFSATINAILGALPFVLITVIEPTKIPLAGGLYE